MFNNDWDKILKDEVEKDYFKSIITKIDRLYKEKTVFPERNNVFRAFKLTEYKNIKVVIIGQDPYHGEGEADGLAFSVSNDTKRPPSLRNIINEINRDLGVKRENNDLGNLARQGVFLINSILTVEKDTALSHKELGWEIFTDRVIELISEKKGVVFILLGKYAQNKKKLIKDGNYIIETSHPSPLSVYRGFNGSSIFSRANEKLKDKINWGD